MLVEDTLGCVEGRPSGHGDVGGNTGPLPGRPLGGVGVDGGDAEEDVRLAHAERVGWVRAARGGLPDDHGSAVPLHDVDELFGGTGCGSAGQDEQTFLGAVSRTWWG